MREVRIPKKNGTFRTVVVPTPKERKELRKLLPKLHTIQARRCRYHVVHGFVPTRSPISNALPHVGKRFSLCFDLANFFDTVNGGMFHEYPEVSALIVKHPKLLYNNVARQGLPTSPALANIAATFLDKDLLAVAQQIDDDIVYTRYADDLTFSYNSPETTDILKRMVKLRVERNSFSLAEHKTKLYDSTKTARNITGVNVGTDGITPTRAHKRRLRAAKHQNNQSQINGLSEWCALKRPTVDTALVYRILLSAKLHKVFRKVPADVITFLSQSYRVSTGRVLAPRQLHAYKSLLTYPGATAKIVEGASGLRAEALFRYRNTDSVYLRTDNLLQITLPLHGGDPQARLCISIAFNSSNGDGLRLSGQITEIDVPAEQRGTLQLARQIYLPHSICDFDGTRTFLTANPAKPGYYLRRTR